MNITGLLRKYNLEPNELAAIALYLHCDEITFAWKNTIGIQSTTKNPTVMASRFFVREEVKTYLYDNKERNDTKELMMFDVDLKDKKDSNINTANNVSGISGDNIKELLEREYNKTTDPEKRTVLLIKIADFIGLKNNDSEDPLTPTIYLPSRCQSCIVQKNTTPQNL